MRFAEVLTIVASVSYKPGYRFHAVQDDITKNVVFTLDVKGLPNAYDGPPTVPVVLAEHHSMLELTDLWTPLILVDILRRMADSFERHEADEWFKVDGIRLHDPHAVYIP